MMAPPASSDASQSGTGKEAESGYLSATDGTAAPQRISFSDAFGDQREGFVVSAPSWNDDLAAKLERLGGDFGIVILSEPPEAPVQAPPRTAICAPAAPAAGRTAVREAAVAYEARSRSQQQSLTAAETKLLREGKLHAAIELTITPELIFKGGKPRLELLARALLAAEATSAYMTSLAVALTAPDTPRPGSTGERLEDLRGVVRDATAALRRTGQMESPEPDAALDRLSQLAASEEGELFLALAHRLYPRVHALSEDVYLLRALHERPAEALEVLAMRAFTREAAVPPTDHDLALDKEIATEQLQFASLIPEPQRLNPARAALDHFRRSYRKRYTAHHRSYWTEVARLRGQLVESRVYVEALTNLNTLTELGPPVGVGTLSTYRELLDSAPTCELIVGVEEELSDAAVCPACSLRLDQEPPATRTAEVLQRIKRAIERQMTRLSSVAVRQVLEKSGDARVERFLKVIQAAQLASLAEVLDKELVGYLRRFLVEARIGSLLNPIMSRLEDGGSPDVEDAQEALRELARVLDRAFRASARSLPAPKMALKSGASKKTGR
ncbi:MAG: hypothetical protein V3S00_04385 [Dehalococcoidia bacterium]